AAAHRMAAVAVVPAVQALALVHRVGVLVVWAVGAQRCPHVALQCERRLVRGGARRVLGRCLVLRLHVEAARLALAAGCDDSNEQQQRQRFHRGTSYSVRMRAMASTARCADGSSPASGKPRTLRVWPWRASSSPGGDAARSLPISCTPMRSADKRGSASVWIGGASPARSTST